jgi:hypothetical protein
VHAHDAAVQQHGFLGPWLVSCHLHTAPHCMEQCVQAMPLDTSQLTSSTTTSPPSAFLQRCLVHEPVKCQDAKLLACVKQKMPEAAVATGTEQLADSKSSSQSEYNHHHRPWMFVAGLLHTDTVWVKGLHDAPGPLPPPKKTLSTPERAQYQRQPGQHHTAGIPCGQKPIIVT